MASLETEAPVETTGKLSKGAKGLRKNVGETDDQQIIFNQVVCT